MLQYILKKTWGKLKWITLIILFANKPDLDLANFSDSQFHFIYFNLFIYFIVTEILLNQM